MATLEMVPLRSMYPNTGRMTLRYTMPAFDVDLDAQGDLVAASVLLASLGGWSWKENHDALQRFDGSFTASVNGRAPVALAVASPAHARRRARPFAGGA